MENSNYNIVNYLKYVEEKLKIQLNNSNLEKIIRDNLNLKVETITEIIERVDFQLKSQEEKQAIRIEWIASLRKRGIDTEKKMQSIVLYEKIREVIPYLLTMNRNGWLQELINHCNKELELIDFSDRSFGNNHISFESIKPLFEKLIQNEEDFTIHPEALKKAKELYEEFKTILG